MARFPVLERRIGHRFADASLLEQSLTHRSFGSPHNERLEFLGDGVLGCAIAEDLCARFPRLDEGSLSRLRATLVREATLAQVARGIDLSEFLRLGEGEIASGGVARPSILADALEALYGAVFLDAGFEAARRVIRQTFGARLEGVDERAPTKDAKTRLQEYLQGRRMNLPRYSVTATHGAAHRQTFDVECAVDELGFVARGTGASRRSAEQKAAEAMLLQLPA
ncbi:MAG: ribonuclease III [Betaproteobacteria bacterium RIFCSPLOWO2_02_FULL_66_14]|nr:MAG: ribonuclease III [Betaproteobacteria bacterium RIFCSPLOWO2_02_FULL_66_14]